MEDIRIGSFSAENKGKTESGKNRLVINNVRPNEVPVVVEEAKRLPRYLSHRVIRRGNGNYNIFIYLSG